MDEREFVASRQATWDRLSAIVAKGSGPQGLKGLPREDLRALGPLYRRAASDLAYARAHAVSPQLTASLNQLAARSFALLYHTDTRGWGGLLQFFTQEFPRTFRRRSSYFLACVGMMLLGGIGAYALVMKSHDNSAIFIPEAFKPSLEVWKSGKVTDKITDSHGSVYASELMTHNIQVSFAAFAFGALGGFPTSFLMFENGAMLGAFAGEMTYAHQHRTFWPAIIPHGVVELSETAIAGAAGLSLGWALLVPGAYRRRDAFTLAARDAAKLVIGGCFLLIFAGLTEGFISHSRVPDAIKVTYGLASGIALYSYLFLAGREKQKVE